MKESRVENDNDMDNVILHAIYSLLVYNNQVLLKNNSYFFSCSEKGKLHVVFKGTDSLWHAKTNATFFPTRFPTQNVGKRRGHGDGQGKVHSGYLEHYKTMRTDLLDQVFKCVASSHLEQDNHIVINLAGHSMGGVLASLMALDCAELLGQSSTQINVFTYGSPPFCDKAFSDAFHMHYPRMKLYRVVHEDDFVPQIPIPFQHTQTHDGNIIIVKNPLDNNISYQKTKHLHIPLASTLVSGHSMANYVRGLKNGYFQIL